MGSNPCRSLLLLGFAHPVVGSPFQVHEKTTLLRGHEYEEGRVVALRSIFVKYIKIIYFSYILARKKCIELYIKLLRIFIRNGLFVRKLYRNRSQYMRYVSVISGHAISTGFRGLTGCQRDPQKLGRHNHYRWSEE